MNISVIRARILVLSILICIISGIHVQVNDGIEVAGNVSAYPRKIPEGRKPINTP